MGARVSSWTHA